MLAETLVLVASAATSNTLLRCFISDLITNVPAAGGLASRCAAYRVETDEPAQIVIDESKYRPELYEDVTPEMIVYLESGWQFYTQLLKFNGLMLHASTVAMDGNAYLFSGPCGRGKSTHTRLWQSAFGEAASVFNDDKPALRRLDTGWFAYGTPWCGKDGINKNEKWPLAGICFLKKAEHNRIRQLTPEKALPLLLGQTTYRLRPENMNLLLTHMDQLLREVPVYELENTPTESAARLSYETMRPDKPQTGEPHEAE